MFIQKMNTAKNPAQAGTWRMIDTLCMRRSLCEVVVYVSWKVGMPAVLSGVYL